MLYEFVDDKKNEYSTADLPVLLRENQPFDLKPEHAAAYLAEGVIKPKGKDADEETIQNAIAQETAEAKKPREPLVRSKLLKMRKDDIIALANSRSISIVPDSMTIPEIADLILATEPEGE